MKVFSLVLVFLSIASISSVQLLADESNTAISDTIASITTLTELDFKQYGYGLIGAASLLSTILIRHGSGESQK